MNATHTKYSNVWSTRRISTAHERSFTPRDHDNLAIVRQNYTSLHNFKLQLFYGLNISYQSWQQSDAKHRARIGY